MIRAREVADFIRAGIDTSFWDPNTTNVAHQLKVIPDDVHRQGEIIGQPDRLVAVNIAGGAPTLGERTRDQVRVQVITRGIRTSDGDAEAVASSADDVLMAIEPQIVMGASRIMSLDYLGGGPAFLDRDDAKRTLFVCQYLFQTARDVT